MMARNNYFKRSNRESRLFEQLVVEQIKIYGFDVHYIFREFQDLDSLFGEDPVSKFRKSFQVEMFVGNYEFFETQDKILDKFGINLQDSISLLVSKKRFTEETAKYDGETIPKEGDIIYFPEYGGLYEIKYVNSRNSFFAYELSCEKFRYSGEQLDTEIVEVDRIEEVFDNMREFQLTDIVGKFHEGEVIYQGLTLGSASYFGTIIDYERTTDVIKVAKETGTPSSLVQLKGEKSLATAYYESTEETNEQYINDPFDNTSAIEQEREELDIIDFSDKDPFSEGDY